MPHVSLSELRANMATYLDRVEADRSELVVTRQNHEPVVIMPLADLEGLRETLHLLGNAANAGRLMAAVAEFDAAGGREQALVDP